MQKFDYCRPTHIVFGAGRVSEIGEIAAKFGKRVLLVSIEEDLFDAIGLREKILSPLEKAGLTIISCFGVKSNPTIAHVEKVLEIARRDYPDAIVAVGGGSVIDECKCISACIDCEGPAWDVVIGKTPIGRQIPVIAVVTMPATSSEMNDTAVISNEAVERKEGFSDVRLVPSVAVLDPELTTSIPWSRTALSAADIVSHLLEAYIVHKEDMALMQNRYCEGMIKTIMDCTERIRENPQDLDARAMFMWTATNSWNGFYVCGLGPGNPAIHILGHSLSALYDTPHGAAMGITIPACIRYTFEERIPRYARMARKVFGVDEDDDRRAAGKGLKAIVAWLKDIGVPTTFAEAGIPTERMDDLVQDALLTAKMWGVGDKYTPEMLREMFELCL